MRKHREDLSVLILDAARELFREEDYQSVTLRRIADKIGCSPTAIYLHYKDKHSLVLQLIVEGFQLLSGYIADASEVEDPVEELRKSSLAYIRFGLEQPYYYRLMFQLQDPELRKLCWENSDQISGCCFGLLLGMIARLRASGRLALPHDDLMIAHILWSGLHGAVCLGLSDLLKRLEPQQHEQFYQTSVHALCRTIAF